MLVLEFFILLCSSIIYHKRYLFFCNFIGALLLYSYCSCIVIVLYSIVIVQVGTYQLAVMAKAMNKPVYAVAESLKFERIYPLNQKEVPNKHKVSYQMFFLLYYESPFLLTSGCVLHDFVNSFGISHIGQLFRCIFFDVTNNR